MDELVRQSDYRMEDMYAYLLEIQQEHLASKSKGETKSYTQLLQLRETGRALFPGVFATGVASERTNPRHRCAFPQARIRKS